MASFHSIPFHSIPSSPPVLINVNHMEVDDTAFAKLLTRFAAGEVIRRKDDAVVHIVHRLFDRDYTTTVVPNHDGVLCASYPPELLIVHGTLDGTVAEETLALERLFVAARLARVRNRFCIPVIRCHGKNICRSGTISTGPEIYLWQVQDRITRLGTQFSAAAGRWIRDPREEGETAGGPSEDPSKSEGDDASPIGSTLTVDGYRQADVELLRALKVGYICDLMVETRKKKYGMPICSSEKADRKNRYDEFALCVMPYPGCEFFGKFHQNGHCGVGLRFDFDQPGQNAQLRITSHRTAFPFSWGDYKTWDLVTLTHNYLLLLLDYIRDERTDASLLIHCVSGWDRTPLFISLLRLSLWAEGEIHPTLTPDEILFLTIAYDWQLFGHQLWERQLRGQDIFVFCFYFLEFMCGPEFCIRPTTEAHCTCLEREKKLRAVSARFTDLYEIFIVQERNRWANSIWAWKPKI